MADEPDDSPAETQQPGWFAPTRWSLVVAAAGQESEVARDALETLCMLYWYPLYAFVRRQGYQTQQAEDLTQGFFAMLLDRGDISKAQPDRGRFRSFLLTALRHYLSNEREHARALKRGGGRSVLSFDFPDAEGRYALEPAAPATDDLFEKEWALLLLERAQQRLREEYATAGKSELYQRLSGLLTGDEREGRCAAAARDLSMTEGAVKVALHRLRQRFGAHLRFEISQTVASSADVDDEVRDLFEALRK